MKHTAMVTGRRNEGFRAVLSVAAVVTGMWVSGVVDRPAMESNVNEAAGDFGEVWTWVAESSGADARGDEPVVSSFDLRCEDAGTEQTRASAWAGRES
jgi:hypothetical protein